MSLLSFLTSCSRVSFWKGTLQRRRLPAPEGFFMIYVVYTILYTGNEVKGYLADSLQPVILSDHIP